MRRILSRRLMASPWNLHLVYKRTIGLVIKFNMDEVIKSMLLLLQVMLSRQVETLKLVKNFIWITTDLYFAENVKVKLIFMINVPRSLRSAIFVEMYAWTLKSVIIVKLFWFVSSVMTNHRSKCNKKHRLCLNVMNGKW